MKTLRISHNKFFCEERLHRNELSLHQRNEKDVQFNFCAYDRVSKMGMVDLVDNPFRWIGYLHYLGNRHCCLRFSSVVKT